MRILTNPGSNLSTQTVRHYDIDLTPQQIVVDGVHHDTRETLDFAQIDSWVATAKTHPYVLGTSSSQFVEIFLQLARRDPEVVAIMTSRKLIQSHGAALAAVRVLPTQSLTQKMHVDVVDSMTSDVGAALLTLAAAEARKAGLPRARIVALLETLALRCRMALTVATLDNLIKGGRAGFLRAFVANFLQVKPLISVVDGELRSTGRITRHENRVERMVRALLESIGPQRPVWIGIVHGGAADAGVELADALRKRLDVAYLYFRPFAPAIYLHTGPGSLGVAALPVDDLPWRLPTPPSFSDASPA